jgi:L-fuculose-phosphate aldolase
MNTGGPEPGTTSGTGASSSDEASARARDMVEAGRALHAAGLIAGLAGNLSVRVDEHTLVITPTATHKGRLEAEQMLEIPLAAMPEQAAAASSEFPFHREAYRARADVGAVVHTHAPALIAVGVRGLDIAALLPEVTLATGAVVTVPLLESGAEALASAVGAAVAGGAGVVLLRRHGAVTVGRDLNEAVHRMELAELAAYAVLLAEDGGGAVERERVTRLSEGVAPSTDAKGSGER